MAPELASAAAARVRDGHEPIVVTGASGWLGRAAMLLLERALGSEQFARRVRAYAGSERDGMRALSQLPEDGVGGALVLHFAFRTRDWDDPSFAADNAEIRATVLRALNEADAPAGVILPSSGAVYRDGDPYGALKRADEEVFGDACMTRGVPLVVPRVFNVAGEGMIRPEDYALGSLVLDALAGRPLQIRARGAVYRSFVSAADLLSVALLALDDAPVTFDAAGRAVEIGELADHVRRAVGRPDLEIVRDAEPGAPADEYTGDPARWFELCARYGVAPAPLAQQVAQTTLALAGAGV